MKAKKSLLVAGAASALSLLTLGGAVMAYSGDATGNTLAEKIAQKFNLDKAEVQKVFDEEHEAHMTAMRTAFADKLNQAVTDGNITGEQKDKILAKQKEMQEYMESLKDKTHQERHEAMKAKMEEFHTWAKENSIPKKYLHIGIKMHHGGHGMGKGEVMLTRPMPF